MKRKTTTRRGRRTRRRTTAKRGASRFTRKVRAVIARQAETKSSRETTTELLIDASLAQLFRGYETGIQNSLIAGALNARIGNEVYTKRQTYNWVFKTSVAVAVALRVVLFKPKTPGNSPGSTLVNFYQGDAESENALGTLADITRDLARQTFTILRDRVYRISPRGEVGSFVHKKWGVRGQGKSRFNEDSDVYPVNKDVYIAFIARRADNDPTTAGETLGEVTCTSIHWYTDM